MRIEGLTEHQVELLDTMWGIEEWEDVEAWLATLSRADRIEAQNLQRLVVLEAFEELLDKDGYPDANRVIDQFRLTK
jgi:DNA-binding transcriptional regulator/RsmH inhibitor MraZ